jgi:hypothetical protein
MEPFVAAGDIAHDQLHQQMAMDGQHEVPWF